MIGPMSDLPQPEGWKLMEFARKMPGSKPEPPPGMYCPKHRTRMREERQGPIRVWSCAECEKTYLILSFEELEERGALDIANSEAI